MRNAGYFRAPTVNGDTVVFVSEDDLWSVPLAGGVARRLTAGRGQAARPSLSPGGDLLAFTSQEEMHPEVFVMPAGGGEPRRLTYLGAQAIVVGWSPDGEIVFRSDTGQPFVGRITQLYAIAPEGGQPRSLPYGHASEVSFGGNGVVVGRNTTDPARWKRYRGGTVGHLWVDARGSGQFRRVLADLDTNIAHPMWIGKRIYFVSDHEGIGNLYSIRPDGAGLRRHTDHDEYYARFASTDGRTIVYQQGANIWALDVATDAARRVEVDFPSPRAQRYRRFVDAAGYVHGFEIHPEGHSLALEARGKAFTMPLWEGAVREHGERTGVRYRRGQWLADGKRLLVVSDAGGEEGLEIHDADGNVTRLDKADIGRVVHIRANPKRDVVALTNHRLELLVVDLASGRATVADRSKYEQIAGLAWSPDGAWLAYAFSETVQTRSIKVYELASNTTRFVTQQDFRDYAPAWDPEGKYLYFLSFRTFDPVYDALFFDLGFPRGTRPYLITLRKDIPSPFIPAPKGFGDKPKPEDEDANGKDKDKNKKKKGDDDDAVAIDFNGIADRILAFPVPEARYDQIVGLKGKVLFSSFPVQGSLGVEGVEDEGPRGTLEVYDFNELKHEILFGGISTFKVSADGATLVYRSGKKLRALKAGDRPDPNFEKDPPSRKSGWIDLARVKVSVEPGAEWLQMYREAWRLQRDNFWTADMSGVDWGRVYERYLPLVEKVATRLEFSDLMWEMQGELGTSHAYEIGGDHRDPPPYRMGYLGADLEKDGKGRWRVAHIVRGDSWEQGKHSPLAAPGVNVEEGDTILAVNGRPVTPDLPPQALLVHQSGALVELTIGDKAGKRPRTVVVKALKEEAPARYREWVERNRKTVHDRTGGRVGYVHVPNMGPLGYAEFHRYYLTEIAREGLLVDVRYNGGGHVSQIILEKLARQRIGYDIKRWGVPEPYPSDSVFGPMVALTNEQAGSDGDIFTHCFKLMQLGPVVGKRTWGGVIGIWPRHNLADNGVTTQPEFSFWFKDVGWGVENYGTDPDYDVDIKPQDHAAGRDPQMDKALDLMMAALKRTPPKLPDFSKRPRLTLPKLPKRPRT